MLRPATQSPARKILRRTCTPSGVTPTSSPRSSTAMSGPGGWRTCPSTSASSTPPGAATPRTSRRSPSRCSRSWTTSGPAYSLEFIRRMGEPAPAERRPWFLYHCTRGAHFDNYPHERFLGTSPAKHPYKDTIIELDDIVGRLVAELEATGQLEDTSSSSRRTTGPRWRPGRTPPTPRSGAPRARPGKGASGCRPSWPGPG